MTNQLKFGIQTNGIKHISFDAMPSINERFLMVKETGIFDYVDKTPEDNEIENFKLASERYNIPIRAGGWFYTIGNHKELLEKNLKTANNLGSIVHNVQIQSCNVEGKIVSDLDVRDAYLEAYDIGMNLGVVPCFETHVNMWSEDFPRVSNVGKLIEDKGIEFNITLDHIYWL